MDVNPIPSMYGIFIYIWLIFMVDVGKYTIHGCHGNRETCYGPAMPIGFLVTFRTSRWEALLCGPTNVPGRWKSLEEPEKQGRTTQRLPSH